MLTSPSPKMALFLKWKAGLPLSFISLEVEQGSRQDRRPGLTGTEGLVEAGVSVVGVVPI